ncbi:hypothetical protein LQZ19_08660 [Treponema primitia]|uniref:hypothetical protein n=1 Tax=Treponema primitia TaxID=88058 RepID=UPI00398091A8
MVTKKTVVIVSNGEWKITSEEDIIVISSQCGRAMEVHKSFLPTLAEGLNEYLEAIKE